MLTFTINEKSLRVRFFETRAQAKVVAVGNGDILISTETDLLESKLSTAEMATIHNQYAQDRVKKFLNRASAAQRTIEVLRERAPVALGSPEKNERLSFRDATLVPRSKENPYREGTKSHRTFEQIIKRPGKTFQEYLDEGGRANTIGDAIRRDLVKVKRPKH